MTELVAGFVIAGRYRLEHQLGEGGMGSVWSAEHLELRSRVAVKLIVPRHASDPNMLTRFVREARAAAALRSPHVVQILDSGIDQGLAFIAMEQLEGESLAERLARLGPLSPSLTATVLTHVARAISRAHEAKLVHRDLKPENIFLVHNDDELVAKVLDFGIAKELSPEREPPSTRTKTGSIVGSPYYMSPEQARSHAVDYRSDLWSLGVVTYECLLGERPFKGGSLSEVILAICVDPPPVPSQHGAVPPGFDTWFARATARRVDERFGSVRELASALRSVLTPDAFITSDPPDAPGDLVGKTPGDQAALAGSMATTSEPTSSEAHPVSPAAQRRRWLGLLAAAVGVFAAALALWPHQQGASLAPTAEPRRAPASDAQAPEAKPPLEPTASAPLALTPASPIPSTTAAVVPSAAPLRPLVVVKPPPRKPSAPAASAQAHRDPLTSRF